MTPEERQQANKRQSEWAKNKRATDPEFRRKAKIATDKSDLKIKYNLTFEKLQAMVEAQKGLCAICKQQCSSGYRLSIDHVKDSNPPFVRGLLCKQCNIANGQFNHDPVLLRKAADYLERAQQDYFFTAAEYS